MITESELAAGRELDQVQTAAEEEPVTTSITEKTGMSLIIVFRKIAFTRSCLVVEFRLLKFSPFKYYLI